ncbi:MAG: sn-glycerol-3-phosphate ABC transporter ATP-binding protein UgpC [Calditrichaeota bacterium]|nr:MAG: sn-glycerol-3-phosphate ABC transporter ATP-binding protein UgpC [Calditrichota bacterium]
MARVELRKVTKIFDGNVIAVKEATLTVEDKEFVVLVGPSGCGKSTLLRMIAGLEEITSGDLFIDGERVNDVPPKDRDIAMVFQNYALYPHMTVYENMSFGLRLRKFPKEEIRRRVEEAADILGIREFLDRRPKALSGGQRQRVAIGRAIVRKPRVFLFDEPLSNLDAKLRVQMRVELNRLHTRLQSTMIYVTHDQVEAMTMGDRIVVLKDGVIQQVDTPLNLYHDPANLFVAGFIGSPAMNMIEGELTTEEELRFRAPGVEFRIPPPVAAKLKEHRASRVIFGVRPESIFDARAAAGRELTEPQSVQVDVVEPIGNEMFLYFNLGERQFCMRCTPDRLYRPGENLQVGFDLRRLYFFDPQTEQRIA